MRVELKALKPNPMRDFIIDPLDDARVEELKTSIQDHGFWGGVACRRSKDNGGIEVGAGWHRVQAAIKAGIREADLFVGNFSDQEMILVYANENALQRGNVSTAIAGSVAAATRFLVKAIMTGNISRFREMSQRAVESAQGNIVSDKGLGEPLVTEFLSGTPGINEHTVRQQLANLKASGDYARIVREVQQEIEKEEKENIKKLELAEREWQAAEKAAQEAEARRKEAEERRKAAAKAERAAKEDADRKRTEAQAKTAELARKTAEANAELAEKRRKQAEKELAQFAALKVTRDTANAAADKAEGREKTFDFEGVAKNFPTSSHIDVFRSLAEGEGARSYLPVNRQAALARALAQLAKDQGAELSGRFIRENFMALLEGARGAKKQLDAQERAELARQDWSEKMRMYQREFARNAHSLLAAAANIASTAKNRPGGVSLHASAEFRTAVQNIEKAVAFIKKAGVV